MFEAGVLGPGEDVVGAAQLSQAPQPAQQRSWDRDRDQDQDQDQDQGQDLSNCGVWMMAWQRAGTSMGPWMGSEMNLGDSWSSSSSL